MIKSTSYTCLIALCVCLLSSIRLESLEDAHVQEIAAEIENNTSMAKIE
jgi:hypothetical protein